MDLLTPIAWRADHVSTPNDSKRAATGNRDHAATLERVRKLLAKAEAEGVTQAEAESLTAKAAELMARYGIDREMARAKGSTANKPGNRKIDIDNPWSQVRAHLLAGIAKAVGCQCVLLSTSKPGARIHVFGFESQLEQVDMLYTSLVLQMARDLKRVRPPAGVRSVRAWNRSWLLGWVTAVITRANAAYAKAVDETVTEAGEPSKEVVLASRDAQITAELRSAYPVTRRTRITYSGRGYSSGYAQGQRANIHDRGEVGNRQPALR
jgi:hypothetical protein